MSIQSAEIDYTDLPVIHGDYEHIQVSCQEALTNIALSSGQTLTFQILGTNVCNLAESYVEFLVTVDPQGPNRYIWMMAGGIPFFRSVAFQPVGGQQLYIDQYHHYSKMSLPYFTALDELKTMDNSNMFFPARALQSSNKLPANGFNAAVPYDEMQYAINIDKGTANNAAEWIVKIPLSMFKGTILAENRDFEFGQAVNIQFTLEDPNKFLWYGTSATDPSAGATQLAVTTNLQFKSMYLQLAVEQNPNRRAEAHARYLSGYRCYVSSVSKLYQQNITGPAQINAPIINRGYGAYLQRIFASPFANVENINTSLDNCNQDASPAVNVANFRVTTFQTILDSQPRQQKYIYASPSYQGAVSATYAGLPGQSTIGDIGDWSRFKKYYEGSSILCSGTLGLNWTFIDEFTAPNSRLQKYVDPSHKIDGLDLSLSDHTWQFLSTGVSNPYNWYVFIQTLRLMEVAPGKLNIY